MRKILYAVGCLFTLTLFFASCDFKDKGRSELDELSDIIIDTTDIPLTHVIARDSVLTIKPVVSRVGTDESNFSYEWRVTRLPGTSFTAYEVIGREKDLNAVINLRPSDNFYSLWYRVTDKTTGLMAAIIFRVQVEVTSEQGLVVAETEDGLTSDLSLIQDTMFTFNYFEKGTTVPKVTSYKRNQYSKTQKKKFNGVVHSMFSQRLYEGALQTNYLHGAAKNNVFRINTSDYSVVAEGKDLFYDKDVELNIGHYFLNGGSQPVMINGGKISTRSLERSGAATYVRFGVTAPGNYSCNKFIALHPVTTQNAIFYDEQLGKFLKLGTSLNTQKSPTDVTAGTNPFNGQDLPGYKVLGGGLGNLTEARFVLNKENYYGIFCFTNAGAPRRLFDISDAPDIANAVSFVFPIDQAVVYYATPQKVYSIRIPDGGTVVYTDLYMSPDPITKLEMLRRSGSKTVAFTERCLLAITYNGAEGKVTSLPIPSTGLDLGLIDLSRKATFGGFKKITAVAVQE